MIVNISTDYLIISTCSLFRSGSLFTLVCKIKTIILLFDISVLNMYLLEILTTTHVCEVSTAERLKRWTPDIEVRHSKYLMTVRQQINKENGQY